MVYLSVVGWHTQNSQCWEMCEALVGHLSGKQGDLGFECLNIGIQSVNEHVLPLQFHIEVV